MSIKPWLTVLAVIALAAVIAAVVAREYVALPIVRDAGYRALVDAYARAVPHQRTPRGQEEPEWNVDLPLPDGASVRVHARRQMAVVSVQYSDETAPRPLYKYEDYSNPVAIRTAGNVLYVSWDEILLHADHWILAYDLASRREIERRRVDPNDLPADHRNAARQAPEPDKWRGEWTGPEGTFLRIDGGDGKYEITIQNLDGPRTFKGTAVQGWIHFERDGVREIIRRTNGAGTGMTGLVEKSNCLVVQRGEGYCRG